jgi:hypothetical protein
MNQLSKMSYNYIKNVKDKEQKILSYYKKINSIEQPKILAIPKRKKNTKKNLDNTKKLDENNELLINKEEQNKNSDNYEKKEDEKKLTKKRVVDMGD